MLVLWEILFLCPNVPDKVEPYQLRYLTGTGVPASSAFYKDPFPKFYRDSASY
jgi:hypothetical protein